METILRTYIRDEVTKHPRGIAVAVKDGDKVNYGFSLVNSRLDKWDKKLGVAIALARATAQSYQLPSVEDREVAVLNAFERLERRAIKYFKDLEYENVAISNHLAIENANV